jgi:hypothetical protein
MKDRHMPYVRHAGYCARFAAFATAALAILAIPLAAAAQGAATVKIGNEVKNTAGLVKALHNGDVSCVIVLQDDQGREFIESGDFDICFQKPSIVGRRVGLKYRLEKVQADECQGDPRCGKSRLIPLVVEARILDAKSAPADQPAAAQGAAQASFCTPLEDVVFACRIGAKLVSVCASKDASRGRGYVQYRFGKPDSRDALELTLPVDRPLPVKAATGESVPFAGGGGVWMRFSKAPFSYTVYSGIGKWGRKGETMTKEGVVVARSGKAIANLKCGGKPAGELGPDWLDKVGIQANGEEFDFPE